MTAEQLLTELQQATQQAITETANESYRLGIGYAIQALEQMQTYNPPDTAREWLNTAIQGLRDMSAGMP